jgi:hypothetical protein
MLEVERLGRQICMRRAGEVGKLRLDVFPEEHGLDGFLRESSTAIVVCVHKHTF